MFAKHFTAQNLVKPSGASRGQDLCVLHLVRPPWLSWRQVPWEALRALLGQSVYGGRVDSVFDQQLLEGFVASLFHPRSFDLNFPLCR